MAFLALGELVDLHGGLPHQEQAAGDQDEVAAGDLRADDGEQRRGQPDDPRQHQQQADAHEHREEQADAARLLALLAAGSLSTRIEMKMMLSMPSTSSSAVNVKNAIQTCGSDRRATMASMGGRHIRGIAADVEVLCVPC